MNASSNYVIVASGYGPYPNQWRFIAYDKRNMGTHVSEMWVKILQLLNMI